MVQEEVKLYAYLTSVVCLIVDGRKGMKKDGRVKKKGQLCTRFRDFEPLFSSFKGMPQTRLLNSFFCKFYITHPTMLMFPSEKIMEVVATEDDGHISLSTVASMMKWLESVVSTFNPFFPGKGFCSSMTSLPFPPCPMLLV